MFLDTVTFFRSNIAFFIQNAISVHKLDAYSKEKISEEKFKNHLHKSQKNIFFILP